MRPLVAHRLVDRWRLIAPSVPLGLVDVLRKIDTDGNRIDIKDDRLGPEPLRQLIADLLSRERSVVASL